MARIDSIFKTETKKTEPHPKRITKWIHYSKIKVDDNNYRFGKTEEEVALTRQRVQALADLISIDGEVLQDLLVRKIDTDEYEIIVGNHRYLACKELVEVRGRSEFEFLPCIVMNISKVRERFMKVSSNGYDQKTDYEIMTEIEEEKYLLTHYPEEFPDIDPGPVIDRLVQATGRKRSTIGEYLKISKNLSPEAMMAFKQKRLNKSAAVEMASFTEQEQNELLEQGITERKSLLKRKEQKAKAEAEKPMPNFGKLPDMKNMEEREDFVNAYHDWEIWCRNKYTEEVFYRYDLPDGSAIIVKEYPYVLDWNQEERIGTELYLWLPDTKHFHDTKSNMTEVKEHLKSIRMKS